MKGSPKLVEVEWLDAATFTDEVELSGIPAFAQLAIRHTIGWLLFDNLPGDSGVSRTIIASTYDPPGGYADITVIPHGWIRKITVRSPKTRRKREQNTAGRNAADRQSVGDESGAGTGFGPAVPRSKPGAGAAQAEGQTEGTEAGPEGSAE